MAETEGPIFGIRYYDKTIPMERICQPLDPIPCRWAAPSETLCSPSPPHHTKFSI